MTEGTFGITPNMLQALHYSYPFQLCVRTTDVWALGLCILHVMRSHPPPTAATASRGLLVCMLKGRCNLIIVPSKGLCLQKCTHFVQLPHKKSSNTDPGAAFANTNPD